MDCWRQPEAGRVAGFTTHRGNESRTKRRSFLQAGQHQMQYQSCPNLYSFYLKYYLTSSVWNRLISAASQRLQRWWSRTNTPIYVTIIGKVFHWMNHFLAAFLLYGKTFFVLCFYFIFGETYSYVGLGNNNFPNHAGSWCVPWLFADFLRMFTGLTTETLCIRWPVSSSTVKPSLRATSLLGTRCYKIHFFGRFQSALL